MPCEIRGTRSSSTCGGCRQRHQKTLVVVGEHQPAGIISVPDNRHQLVLRDSAGHRPGSVADHYKWLGRRPHRWHNEVDLPLGDVLHHSGRSIDGHGTAAQRRWKLTWRDPVTCHRLRAEILAEHRGEGTRCHGLRRIEGRAIDERSSERRTVKYQQWPKEIPVRISKKSSLQTSVLLYFRPYFRTPSTT
jgi:hypothetical protein